VHGFARGALAWLTIVVANLAVGWPASVDAAGFEVAAGTCPVLDTELTLPTSAVFTTRAGIEACDVAGAALSPGGADLLAAGNAGGSSLYSEIAAFELLFQCESASLLATETEIDYDQPGPLADMLVEIDGVRLAVGVTRALAFPFDVPIDTPRAAELLTDKLDDLAVSTANVSEADRWEKPVLVVLTPLDASLAALETAYAGLDASTRGETIVWFVRTSDEDAFLYENVTPDCDLPSPVVPKVPVPLPVWAPIVAVVMIARLACRPRSRRP